VPVAPFEVGVVNLKSGDKDCDTACEAAVAKLEAAGIDVLYDDRDERAGAKFATMDVTGIPYQLIIGPKGVKASEAEIKVRKGGERKTVPMDGAVNEIVAAVKAQRLLA
jgi:prolyl-tRNA synthetase